MSALDYTLVLLVLVSHAIAVLPFLRALRHHIVPRTIDFATASFILYYDVDLALQSIGVAYANQYFPSWFSTSEGMRVGTAILLSLAPWLMRIGGLLAHQDRAPLEPRPLWFRPSRRAPFHFLAALAGTILLLYGLISVGSQPLYAVRVSLAQAWGPLVIVFYLPTYLLAFYLAHKDARSHLGTVFAAYLVLAAAIATLPVGERTLLLLPILMFVVLRLRPSPLRLLSVGMGIVVVAALMLAVYKWQYAETNVGTPNLVVDTLSTDIARAPVLATALSMSDALGTKIMPYPGAGYVYSALFLVPRGLAPWKGSSSASYFTAQLVGGQPESLGWGFGLGFVEEASTNFGLAAVPFVLLVAGALAALSDRLSFRFPSLTAPTRFAALMMCGYDLPSLILLFGIMAIVGLLLSTAFSTYRRPLSEPTKTNARRHVDSLQRPPA
jgi:hypothetical protein